MIDQPDIPVSNSHQFNILLTRNCIMKYIEKCVQYKITHTASSGGCYARISHSFNISTSTMSWVIYTSCDIHKKETQIMKVNNLHLK